MRISLHTIRDLPVDDEFIDVVSQGVCYIPTDPKSTCQERPEFFRPYFLKKPILAGSAPRPRECPYGRTPAKPTGLEVAMGNVGALMQFPLHGNDTGLPARFQGY